MRAREIIVNWEDSVVVKRDIARCCCRFLWKPRHDVDEQPVLHAAESFHLAPAPR